MRPPQRLLLIAVSIAAMSAIGWIALELDRADPAAVRDVSGVPAPAQLRSDEPNDRDARVASTPLANPSQAASPHAGGGHAGRERELRIMGRVVGRGGRPIEGAGVRIEIETADSTHEVALTRSGVDGRYAARATDLGELDPQSRSLATLCVAVDASGFQPQTRRQGLSWSGAPAAEPERVFEMDFRLAAGSTLSGRVVDARGKSVRGASVVLVAGSRAEGSGPRPPESEVASGPDGRFELGFVSGGKYRLWARKDGCGSARLDELELSPGEDRRLGDVALVGAGLLTGSVRYPDGSPVRDLELWAVPESLAREANALALAASRAAELEGGDGLLYASSSTDARGEFRVQGLREGSYALRLAEVHLVLEPRAALYHAPADSIHLVLDAYRLRVRVRSQSGAPLCGAVVACTSVEAQADGGLEAGSTSHATAAGRDALATFEVLPEQTYALSARAPGSREAEDLVILAPGEFELERTLVLEPALELGRLRVSVSGQRGESLGRLRVALLSPLSAQPIAELGVLTPDEQGWLPPLAPGRYGVEVGFEPELDPPPMHFPVRSRDPIEIESGRDHEISLTARAGGRLWIAISIAGPPPRGFAPPDTETGVDPGPAFDAWLAENGARAELVSSDGRGRLALQFLRPPAAPGESTRLQSRLAPGDVALVERLLEPGLYTLRVEASGFRTVEMAVEVQASVARRVEVALRAE